MILHSKSAVSKPRRHRLFDVRRRRLDNVLRLATTARTTPYEGCRTGPAQCSGQRTMCMAPRTHPQRRSHIRNAVLAHQRRPRRTPAGCGTDSVTAPARAVHARRYVNARYCWAPGGGRTSAIQKLQDTADARRSGRGRSHTLRQARSRVQAVRGQIGANARPQGNYFLETLPAPPCPFLAAVSSAALRELPHSTMHDSEATTQALEFYPRQCGGWDVGWPSTQRAYSSFPPSLRPSPLLKHPF